MKARALLLGIALVFLTGSLAFAQDDDEEEEIEVDPTQPGWYVGGSAGGALENFSGGIRAGDAPGGDITVGHRASEFLSFELEGEFLKDFDVKARAPGLTKSEVEIFTATVNFRVHFPIEESRWEPYLTYGVGLMNVETKDTPNQVLGRFNHSNFMMKGGGGIAYQYTDAMSLYVNGTYAFPFGKISQFDHAAFTVGFLYKFISDEY